MLRQGSNKPQAFEIGAAEQMLAGIFLLLQQNVHVSSRSQKKFRGKPWPSPETAADLVKAKDAERGYDDLMAEIVFLPQDEFDAHITEHAANDVLRIERE